MIGHLIHIGFAKTASTLLQRWFVEHPQLGFSPMGIGGFHDVLDIANAAASGQTGIRYRVTSSEALSAPIPRNGTAWIDYASRGPSHAERQAEACRLLAALSPRAHILIVTRGFRSMLLSSYSQYVRTGGAVDLEDLLAADDEDSPWHYDRVTGLYRETFGDDRVLVLPWELLRDDRVAFGRAIETGLGLDHHPLPRETVNQALSPVELRWYPRVARAIERLPVGARARRRILACHAGRAMNNRFRLPIRLLQRLRPAPAVTAELVSDALIERFRGQADTLATDPHYAPYARDYLFPEGRSTSAV